MPKLLIIIQGGVVVNMYSDSPMEVKIIDMDSEEVGEESLDEAYALNCESPEGYEVALAECKNEIKEERENN